MLDLRGCDDTRRAEQKEARQKQILEIALDIFVRKGFAATRITDIAEAAGMSKGLMFNYFSSKEELYETLVDTGIQESGKLLAKPYDDALGFFVHVAAVVIRGVNQNPKMAKMFVLMHDASRGDFLPDDARRRLLHDNITKSAGIIEAGQQQGTVREGDPCALASVFWGAVLGVCHMAVQNRDFVCPDPEWIVSMMKRGN